MDVIVRSFCGSLLLALVVGLLIALMPVILFILGFLLMIGFLAFVGRLLGSWVRY